MYDTVNPSKLQSKNYQNLKMVRMNSRSFQYAEIGGTLLQSRCCLVRQVTDI